MWIVFLFLYTLSVGGLLFFKTKTPTLRRNIIVKKKCGSLPHKISCKLTTLMKIDTFSDILVANLLLISLMSFNLAQVNHVLNQKIYFMSVCLFNSMSLRGTYLISFLKKFSGSKRIKVKLTQVLRKVCLRLAPIEMHHVILCINHEANKYVNNQNFYLIKYNQNIFKRSMAACERSIAE